MKIAFYSSKSYDKDFFSTSHTEGHDLVYFEAPLNLDTVNLSKEFDVVCAFVNDHLDKAVLTELKINGVKLIALRCAGFNNVDLEAASILGIKVVRVPSYSPSSVAEHAVALLLTLNRKTHKAYNRVKEGNFSLERLLGFDLKDKVVGVIGTGLIGSYFCKMIAGFGCQVVAYDVFESDDLKKIGVKYVPLDDLLSSSDVISLHCPLLEQTYHIIDKNSLAKMKDGAMLINTSRGGLIDTEAALTALKTGKLGYLGIDVYEQEESLFFKDLSENVIQDDVIARLTTFPNVLITAHQGFFTREALTEIAETTMRNIAEFEKGETLTNEVKA